MKIRLFGLFFLAVIVIWASVMTAQQVGPGSKGASSRPKGPCDIYTAASDACVAAHSTTRALYAGYNGPLYQVVRQSDGKALDIGIVQPGASDGGGYADAAAQDRFCANTYCWISKIYDQSPKHNDLTQAPRGGFSGPALGGFNTLPLADMAPISVMGHKVYGVFIEPGMGLRIDDVKGTAVDDQAEGQYWVVNGRHFNSGCCFDYGNAEIDSRDDDNGTMETAYFGDATPWFHGPGNGPWIMTDQENNLVGCVNTDGTKGCPNLPTMTSRFVTAIAKGEPHHWTSMGGDAQQGALQVMFSGQRVNATYDPMRKQGAILLGNGGDNSNSSQGTFYEGAITAAGTFPKDATDQEVQANVVAARYGAEPLSIAPASAVSNPPGLQIFTPGSSQDVSVTYTNTTEAPANGVTLSVAAPEKWTAVVSGGSGGSKNFAEPVAPGASVSATFKVTSGSNPFNGDLVANVSRTNQSTGAKEFDGATEKVRNVSPVKINEFRISSGSPANSTDSFIELYNAGSGSIDISNWTLTVHPSQQAISSSVKIPVGTTLANGKFYLLGLANSGVAAATRAGENTVFVRSTAGMNVGDTVMVDSGSDAETRKITKIGSAATNHTTLWQPLPEGPVITSPAGSTNVPVMSVDGFKVGEKIALGYGATYPAVARDTERYEVATVTAVGNAGTQAYLAADAAAGATNLQVTSANDISVGDKIRLDIDSVGHGIETVTVTRVGTAAARTNLSADASAGSTTIHVRNGHGIAVGAKITVGTPANRENVNVASVGGTNQSEIQISPALARSHIRDEWVVGPGTGLELAAALKYNHAANLPFGDRGTGITFEPATAFAHSSNEPAQALGTGITLDKALGKDHAVNAVVRDGAVKTAGYQGSPEPNEWFGGPELITIYPLFERTVTLREGSIVLRDASGVVVDSLNYGGMVDPWAAQGYQAASGSELSGCYAPAPGAGNGFGPAAARDTELSTGRFPDGADTGSNCNDFRTQAATALLVGATGGETNIKVSSVKGFVQGASIKIDGGVNEENAVITTVGTAGATKVRTAVDAGTVSIPVASGAGFRDGETISVDNGANAETAVIVSIARFPAPSITVTTPLAHPHAVDAQVSGTGISLASPLTRKHGVGTQVRDNVPTPGGPNRYQVAR